MNYTLILQCTSFELLRIKRGGLHTKEYTLFEKRKATVYVCGYMVLCVLDNYIFWDRT